MAQRVFAWCTTHQVNLDLRMRMPRKQVPEQEWQYRCPAAAVNGHGKSPDCAWVIEYSDQ